MMRGAAGNDVALQRMRKPAMEFWDTDILSFLREI